MSTESTKGAFEMTNTDWQDTAKIIRSGLNDLKSNIMPYLKNKKRVKSGVQSVQTCLDHSRSGFFLLMKFGRLLLSLLILIVTVDFMTSMSGTIGSVYETWGLIDTFNWFLGLLG